MDQKEISIEYSPESMNNSIIVESDVQFRLVSINVFKFYHRVSLWATFLGQNFYEIKTVNSYEKNVYEEKTLQEQIEEQRKIFEALNKTVCSNSSHPQYELCGIEGGIQG